MIPFETHDVALGWGFSRDDCLLESEVMGVRNKPIKPYTSIALPVLMAVFFIFIALKTLLGRRPLVLSSRWIFGLMCLASLPEFLTPLSLIRGHMEMISWLGPAVFGFLLGVVWI